MAETKNYQLLAHIMRIDGVEHRRGDTVALDPRHADTLMAFGSVGPVGGLEKRAKAHAEAQALVAQAERELLEQETASLEAEAPGANAPTGGPRQTGPRR